MPSGWDVYYVVFLSALLALSVPAALGFISFLVSQRLPKRSDSEMMDEGPQVEALETDTVLGRRVNTRFFLGANAALILLTFSLVLVPCVGTLHPANGGEHPLRGLVSVLSLVSFAALGLLYSARKGDLDWLKSYRDSGESK